MGDAAALARGPDIRTVPGDERRGCSAMIEKHIDWDNAVDQSILATEPASLIEHLRQMPELTAEPRLEPRLEFGAAPRPKRSSVPPTRSRSFPLRYWRGEFSLPVSYWLVGTGTNLGFALIGGAILAFGASGDRPAVLLGAILAFWLSCLLLMTWQQVGLWRSAGHAWRDKQTRFWPIVARIMVITAVMLDFGIMRRTAVPQIADAVSYVGGDSDRGPHGIRVLRHGTEIEVIGFLGGGLVDEFRTALDHAPNATIVHLASPGGRVGVGLALRDEIRRHRLDTYVASVCASACTAAFLGGGSRWLKPDAKLGFHRSRDLNDHALNPLIDPLAAAYREAGLPTEFIDHVLQILPSDIWYPTADELLTARVITPWDPQRSFALSGFGLVPDAAKFTADLGTFPQYRALRQADPPRWDNMAAIWTQAINEGWSVSEARAAAHSQFVQAVLHAAPSASDATIIPLAHFFAAEAKLLAAKDAEACWGMLTGALPIAPETYLPKSQVDAETAVFGAVLAEVATDHRRDAQDLAAGKTALTTALRRAHLDPSAVDSVAARGAHTDYCSSMAAIYDALLTAPDAGAALRYLASQP
jgi:hypothetical protein